MKVGIIGLGKMGQAIAQRLLNDNHVVYGFDINNDVLKMFEKHGGTPVHSLKDLVKSVDIVWLMIPAGELIDKTLDIIKPLITTQIIVDGGNSKYTDSIRRATLCSESGIAYLDCGTSGGLAGCKQGFCLMVGGDKKAFDTIVSVLKSIAAPEGYAYVGSSGTGHYVKMIHNGIEYALLQSYAEGFNLLKNGEFKDLDLAQIAGLWEHGSIVRSWILTLLHGVLEKDQQLKSISGKVAESGMGRWTVELAEKEKIPVPLIQKALEIRKESQKSGGDYATKLVALLRNVFGGHAAKKL
ncbi:6-phosphogluconate dehydrogenase (decarboxylating) [candidate division TM6 bacterium RIFCSPHIGHO2_12_FULL_36_22]|nr:MAG: 6-phosphogluconate dehydrogenase (decarboxylating) [candidate division TM6 bacterium RIFCSPHIGHO2_12_FULL_36_22]